MSKIKTFFIYTNNYILTTVLEASIDHQYICFYPDFNFIIEKEIILSLVV